MKRPVKYCEKKTLRSAEMSPLNFDPKNDGYWGDTTSTLDWCEQNYEVRWVGGDCLAIHRLVTN